MSTNEGLRQARTKTSTPDSRSARRGETVMTFRQQWSLELGSERERFIADIVRVGKEISADSGLGPLWDPAFVLAVSLDVGLKILAARLEALGIHVDVPNV